MATFTTRFPGNCKRCGEHIAAGDTAHKFAGSKGIVHPYACADHRVRYIPASFVPVATAHRDVRVYGVPGGRQ